MDTWLDDIAANTEEDEAPPAKPWAVDPSRCEVEDCPEEGTEEFMGKHICMAHLLSFTNP